MSRVMSRVFMFFHVKKLRVELPTLMVNIAKMVSKTFKCEVDALRSIL